MDKEEGKPNAPYPYDPAVPVGDDEAAHLHRCRHLISDGLHGTRRVPEQQILPGPVQPTFRSSTVHEHDQAVAERGVHGHVWGR